MILLNGQWQGGADKVTLVGLEEIKKFYLEKNAYEEVQIDEEEALVNEAGIIGLTSIKKQTMQAWKILQEKRPSKLFTVGGGCDADVASIAYLNQLYQGDLCVLWFDAHGDINSPEESETHLFYGMPVRALLGDCGEALSETVPLKLKPDQILQIGGRAFDIAEAEYIKAQNILHIGHDSVTFTETIMDAVKKTGKQHCYIHLDLDVLDPREFPYVPVPEAGGVALEELKKSMVAIAEKCNLVGFGLYEYAPQEQVIPAMDWFVKYGMMVAD
ncbi:arginase family protein [Phascolarctobacterium sp.]|uniref:arginase family protein n=1 Tax=Phascolarctobacterium sp. TaxID=2049039 RepID=UPI0038662602